MTYHNRHITAWMIINEMDELIPLVNIDDLIHLDSIQAAAIVKACEEIVFDTRASKMAKEEATCLIEMIAEECESYTDEEIEDMTKAGYDKLADIASQLNANGYTYYGERAKAWQGGTVERVYFGKEYVSIINGKPTNEGQRARAKTIGSSAVEAIEALLVEVAQ